MPLLQETTTMTKLTILNDFGRGNAVLQPNNSCPVRRLSTAGLLGLAALMLASAAQADDISVTWQVSGHPISTSGYLPKVATDGIQNVATIDEIGTGLSDFQSHIGTLFTASVSWAAASEYLYGPSLQIGHAPSIALAFDAADDYSNAIEVHQGGQDNDGALWFQIGSNSSPSFSKINWSSAYQYDTGYNPTVAADLNSSSNTEVTVVEVHQATANSSALWYHVGAFALGPLPFITWGPSFEFDGGLTDGFAPTVSVANNVAVLVAQGTGGTLWYSIGVVDVESSTINWTAPVQYATGYNPTVSVYGDGTSDYIGAGRIVVEAHQVDNSTGPLSYSVGMLKNGKGGSAPSSITWSTSQNDSYATGCYPSVALSFSGYTPSNLSLTETHETACGVAAVQYSFGYPVKK
jgi:hypothetical protein